MELTLLLHQLRLATVIAFYASLVFPGVVAPCWPWWKEGFGWNVVLFDYSFCMVAFPTWLNVTFGLSVSRSLFWGFFELIGVYFVIINIIIRTIIIYEEQRKARRQKHEREKANAAT